MGCQGALVEPEDILAGLVVDLDLQAGQTSVGWVDEVDTDAMLWVRVLFF